MGMDMRVTVRLRLFSCQCGDQGLVCRRLSNRVGRNCQGLKRSRTVYEIDTLYSVRVHIAFATVVLHHLVLVAPYRGEHHHTACLLTYFGYLLCVLINSVLLLLGNCQIMENIDNLSKYFVTPTPNRSTKHWLVARCLSSNLTKPCLGFR